MSDFCFGTFDRVVKAIATQEPDLCMLGARTLSLERGGHIDTRPAYQEVMSL